MKYLDRGWITKDEYEDFIKYLWNPYSSFGGNGLAEKIMADVQKLNIRSDAAYPHSPGQIIRIAEEKHVNGIPSPHSSS